MCFSGECKQARYYFNFFIYFFTYFCLSLFTLPLLLCRPQHPDNIRLLHPAFKYVGQNVIGLDVEIRNSKVLGNRSPAVVVCNHQSSIDSLLLLQIWGPLVEGVINVAKKGLIYVFPFGPASWLLGSMFLNRNDRKSAFKSLENIGDVVKAKKGKVWIYPEGTRNHNKEILLPFKKGAFHLAITAQLPIIIVVTSPYYFINYKTRSFEKPRIIMQVLDEIPTTGLTLEDLPGLMEEVRNKTLETYHQLRKEVMNNHAKMDNAAYDVPGSLVLK